MQVFKIYFRLLKSYKGVIILYASVFLAIAIIMSNVLSEGGSGEEAFVAERLDIGVIDRDHGSFAKSLMEYFGQEHDMAEVKDDEDVVLDELYWREVDYVLVIPEGFEQSLTDTGREMMELNCMKVPGSFESSFFESELSMYLSKLTGLVESGAALPEAFSTLQEIQEEKAEVNIADFVNEAQGDRSSNFFLFVPYFFITLGISGVGLILLVFNQRDLKDRMECSSLPLKSRIGGLTGGIFVFGILLLVLVLAVAGVITGGKALTDSRLPYFVLNMLSMLLFSLSLGFLSGTVSKNEDALNGINNVVSLALCFLGGIFVPQEFFGEGVLKVAKFFPTYWYVRTNTAISSMTSMTDALGKEIAGQILLVIIYAVAIFALTTVVISAKRKRTA